MAQEISFFRPLAFFLLSILGGFFSPPPAVAQEPSEAQRQQDLHEMVKFTEKSIELIRPHLFSGLTGQDLKVYREIEVFRVSDKDTLSRSSSGWEDGQRAVIIDVGYERQIFAMAQAYMIEIIENKPVVIPYIRYVITSWHDHASFIKGPPDFANFNFDKVINDPKQLSMFDRMNTASLAFILAHEVGHHVLGHNDKPWPTDPAKLREMEIAADAWALKCLQSANPHFSPLSGLLPLIFGYYVSPSPIDAEQHSDHPADLRRIQIMFQAMKDSLPAYRKDMEKEGQAYGVSYDEFKKFVDQSLSEYEAQIETDSPPVAPYPAEVGKDSHSGEGPFGRQSPPPMQDQPVRKGAYCGDVHGTRFCAMSVLATLGTACGCPGVPGWGVVVP
jgi:hypothetical protein